MQHSLHAFTGPSAGLALMLLFAMNVRANSRHVLAYVLVSGCSAFIVHHVLVKSWTFPIPMGVLVVGVPAITLGVLALFVSIFGLDIFTNKRLQRRVLPMLGMALLPSVFIIAFAFFRVFFMWVDPGWQAVVAPLWPIAKILLKELATWLADLAMNVRVPPFPSDSSLTHPTHPSQTQGRACSSCLISGAR